MTAISYENFDLLIDQIHGGGYQARVVNSPAGDASVNFSLPFSEGELRSFFWLSGRVFRGLGLEPDAPEPGPLTPQEFGTRLYQAVFAGQVGTCLLRSLDAVSEGVGLRIRLRLDRNVPELADLPWEYLYAPELSRFIVLSDQTVIARYIELPQPQRPLRVRPPLRMLAMVSDPSDAQILNVEHEWERLGAALTDLRARGLIVLERLERATLPALQDRLRRDDVHILHYIGHGYFDEDAGGGLLLEDEGGYGHLVNAGRLGTLLHDHDPLRLVFLNACEGARSGGDHDFAGTAQTLVQGRTPAVIAMQFEVSDQAAMILAREFYEAIADGYPVDAALAEARKAVYAEGDDLEWGTPVLFSRSPDNQILELALEEARPGIEPLLFEPETIYIPAGPFLMGSQPGPGIPEHETLQHEVDLPAYRIGKYPVTNAEYEAFVRATGRVVAPELGWDGQTSPLERRNHPVAGVSWNEALAYCAWLSDETGRDYCLPNEAQWEKAARGSDGRRYPWGDTWEDGRSNCGGQGIAAVDAFPPQSSHGCYDMLGNVREWTCSLWGERLRQPEKRFQYPWRDDERNDLNANDQIRRVWRGGAYADGQRQLRCAARGILLPNSVGAPRKRMGFRVVMKLVQKSV